MKTRQLFVAMTFMAAMGMNAQNVASTSTLTSGGLNAGGVGGGDNTYYGAYAGNASTTNSSGNTFIGKEAGRYNTMGVQNVIIGNGSGFSNTIGSYNVFEGQSAGAQNTTGSENVFLGYNSGSIVTTGIQNTFVGANTGQIDMDGDGNTLLGYSAGGECYGNDNVFIGKYAGYGLGSVSNKLIISNSISSARQLIWGDFATDLIKLNAKVGIGGVTSFPTTAGTVNVTKYKLIVKDGILTEEVRVSLANTWADYVFNNDYKLAPLADVECFITENGHLPNVPSAAQVKEEGIELGDMARIQQEKIEELTLYLIQQNKKLEEQDKEIKELKAAVQHLLEKK